MKCRQRRRSISSAGSGKPAAFVPNGSVVSFEVCVLLRLARTAVVQPNVVLSSPFENRRAQRLRRVTTPQRFGPRHARLTRSDGSEKSISISRASRLKSSITLNNRKQRPWAKCHYWTAHASPPHARKVQLNLFCERIWI
ncbi:hypothetical protein BVIET440_60112 [Burkholderia vietnamiensis]|nr:hypothetical protein BVI2075_250039 [Burkholderia vietnamiensis]CAG9225913.1 hypothetical protein BVI1335_580007 [Burkholderia vietnamiensis]